nr:YbgC/FadM family acyl-CoA thioesterase [Legionella oakridgensis]
MFMIIDKEHNSYFRVYVEDVDHMGIVYHANYLYFFERARTDMLRDFGLSLTSMAKYGTHFAIRDVHIRYFHPARLDELLTIKTKCTRSRASTLEFRQLMYNQKNHLLSEVIVCVVCVNDHLKPKRLPDTLLKE